MIQKNLHKQVCTAPGTPVQQWMTYRDAETYRSIVRKGAAVPAELVDVPRDRQRGKRLLRAGEGSNDSDFADQVWSYFATGTQLQELYITLQC